MAIMYIPPSNPKILELAQVGYGIYSGLKNQGAQEQKDEQSKKIQDVQLQAAQAEIDTKKQETDPTSPLSIAARGFAKRVGGLTLPDDVSAKQIKDNESILKVAIEKLGGGKDLDKENKRLDIEKKKRELSQPNLPQEIDGAVKNLTLKNADKVSIANQIDSAMSIFNDPNTSETQKIKTGETLLKTLNSSEGKDAVGTDEARRLGSLLQNKMFNWKEAGSWFGRDLEEFSTQATNTANSIRGGIAENQKQIDALKNGKGFDTEARPLMQYVEGTKGGSALKASVIGGGGKSKAPVTEVEQNGWIYDSSTGKALRKAK